MKFSVRNAERKILKAAARAGLIAAASGLGSRYIRVSHADKDYGHNFGFTVRVSDHSQAAGGGYNESRGERHGESTYSVSPLEMTVEQVVAEIEEEGARAARDIEEWRFQEVVCGF